MSRSLESSVSDLACNRQLAESLFLHSQMQMRISVRYEPADVLFVVDSSNIQARARAS